MSDNETFTRLLYYGTVQMGLTHAAFWLMPIGLFLDLWECHKQYHGIAESEQTNTVDDFFDL